MSIHSLEREKEALVSENAALIKYYAEVISELESLKFCNSELESNAANQKKEIAARGAEISELLSTIERQTTCVVQYETINESLRCDVLNLQDALAAKDIECTKLTATADNLEGKIVSLSSSYDEMVEKKRKVQQELSRVTEEMQTMKDEQSKIASQGVNSSQPTELYNRCMEAEAKAFIAKDALSGLDEEVLSLRGQNEILKEQSKELEAELDRNIDKVNVLKKRLRVYAQRVTQLEVMVAEAQSSKEEHTENQFVRRMMI